MTVYDGSRRCPDRDGPGCPCIIAELGLCGEGVSSGRTGTTTATVPVEAIAVERKVWLPGPALAVFARVGDGVAKRAQRPASSWGLTLLGAAGRVQVRGMVAGCRPETGAVALVVKPPSERAFLAALGAERLRLERPSTPPRFQSEVEEWPGGQALVLAGGMGRYAARTLGDHLRAAKLILVSDDGVSSTEAGAFGRWVPGAELVAQPDLVPRVRSELAARPELVVCAGPSELCSQYLRRCHRRPGPRVLVLLTDAFED